MKPLYVPPTFPIVNNQFKKSDECKPTGLNGIIAAAPMNVNTYSQMVDMVSKLAYFNKRYILFFRGQSKEYRLGHRYPTIFPTYFREIIKDRNKAPLQAQILDQKQEELKWKNHNRTPRFYGASSIWESPHVRWALLQHYGICDTPLLDVTQSLYVATSFALLNKNEISGHRKGIVYVLALPWPSKNSHLNTEEELYIVRLAGKTPPQAKRPYRQEAFAIMSTDVDTKQMNNLNRYDFANRLVCKFEVNDSKEFWGSKMYPLSGSYLVPKEDIFYEFMRNDLQLTVTNR